MGSRRGFTLLELIVGLGVLVLLVALVQGIYVGAARNRNTAEKATAEVHGPALALQKLADEVAAAFISPDRLDQTHFYLDTSSAGFSSLEFTSRTVAIAGFRPGGDTRLRYEQVADPDSEEEGAYLLERGEMADLYGDLDRDGVSFTMLKGIKRFTVECYDREAEEWTDSWDSSTRDPAVERLLPVVVRLEVAWGDEDNERVMRTATPIYGGW